MNNKDYDLVRIQIKGKRKGMDKMQYLHSFEVADILEECWFDENVCLAGLLHDVIEDGNMTTKELKDLGYNNYVVGLVDLCSHDNSIKDSFERWMKMIRRLIKNLNMDAWAIKIADYISNLRDCEYMSKNDMWKFLFKKWPIFLYYGKIYFWWTELYERLMYEYYNKVKVYNGYNF